MSDDPLFGSVMDLFLAESKRVWNDPAVWNAERDRQDEPARVVWPMPLEGTAYERELAVWFNGEVDAVLFALATTEEAAWQAALPDLPPYIRDPRFQLVLRVVGRAWSAGREAVEQRFVAGQRITGWGEYRSQWRSKVVDWAGRKKVHGMTRQQVYEAFGISKSAANRKMNLKKSRGEKGRKSRSVCAPPNRAIYRADHR